MSFKGVKVSNQTLKIIERHSSDPREFTRATASKFFFLNESGEEEYMKRSNIFEQWFQTEDGARKWIADRVQEKLDYARREVTKWESVHEENLKAIKGLK